MKPGSEDKNKVKIMMGLMAAAVLIIGYNLLIGPSTLRANPSQTSSTHTGQPKKAAETASSLDPTLQLNILRTSQGVLYGDGGRNIFRMEAAGLTIPPIEYGVHAKAPPPQPPGPTDLPPKVVQPITLRFYGFANKRGEPKRIFLSDNGEHFLAREGDIVERRYRIVQIISHANGASVIVEDVLNNTRKTLPLTPSPN